MRRPSRILLTGPPGCGKTTAVMRTLQRLSDTRVVGFYTREVRNEKGRVGFDAVGLSTGRSVRLASVQSTSKIRVGRYRVELADFERLLDDEFRQPHADVDLVVIDEIGKMECHSSVFVETVRELLDAPISLLATVAQRGAGFIREVKDKDDIELLTVTTANRGRLPGQLVAHFAMHRPHWIPRPNSQRPPGG